MAEIAPDPPGWITALRFDIDAPEGGIAWLEAELPPPNLIVVNPRNGHAHLVYQLGAWVRTDFDGGLKVVRYAAAIERAYTAALDADPAYSGRFQHNPLSDAYVTKVGRDAPYSLEELARYVDLYEPREKKVVSAGLGRNVEIFDRLRRWAYAAVTGRRIGTYEAWYAAVTDRAGQIAGDVGLESASGPLKANEVGHIITSVARWVWERYGAGVSSALRESRAAARRERERERQAVREKKRERGRVTRTEYLAPAQQRRERARQLRLDGTPVREIARLLAISIREVYRLVQAFVTTVVPDAQTTAARVQGAPAPSDFTEGAKAVDSERLGNVAVLAPSLQLESTRLSRDPNLRPHLVRSVGEPSPKLASPIATILQRIAQIRSSLGGNHDSS